MQQLNDSSVLNYSCKKFLVFRFVLLLFEFCSMLFLQGCKKDPFDTKKNLREVSSVKEHRPMMHSGRILQTSRIAFGPNNGSLDTF